MGQYPVLKFKDFVFPYNPRRFTVEGAKQIFHQFAPGFGSIVSDLGRTARLVRGEGEFFGDGAKEQFAALSELFLEQEDGLLALPVGEPFYAYFSSLILTGTAGADMLSYSFSFIESSRSTGELYGVQPSVTAGRSQTLWQLAAETGVPVEELYRNNPSLYTEGLEEGMEVKLC